FEYLASTKRPRLWSLISVHQNFPQVSLTRSLGKRTMSFSLGSDNHSGIHPSILEAIQMANVGHAHSYGMDEISLRALTEWNRVFGREVSVFYVFNGTAANVLALQSFVHPFEAVACSEHAHLHLDECGGPEKHIGCKVYDLQSHDGKIFPPQM